MPNEINSLESSVEAATVTGRGFGSRQAIGTLLLLTMAYACVALDRAIISVVLEPIKNEFQLTDAQLGLMPMAFSLFFVAAGIPLGMLADRVSRRRIIAGCLLAFSMATVLCGAAQNFWQLLLARVGVGAGESGSGPAAMSMISELFPEHQRASALSCYYLAAPAGIILTFVVGGYLVGAYGWRLTFLLAGLPGIALAGIVLLVVRDQRELGTRPKAAPACAGQLRSVVRRILSKPALRNLAVGTTLNSMVSASVVTWCGSFLLRTHDLPVQQAGLLVGLFYGGVSMVGVLGGGIVADRLSRSGEAWRCRLLTLAALFSAPTLLGMLLVEKTSLMLACFAAWAVLSSIWYGPAYGLTQSLVPAHQRATVASVLYLLSNLIGVGLGPQLVGLLSDAFVLHFGVHSLAYAMAVLAIGHVWAAWHFHLASRAVENELAEQYQS